jgi:alcohol dehydrogenase
VDWEFDNPVHIVGGIGSVTRVASLVRSEDDRTRGTVVVVSTAAAQARGDLDPLLAGFDGATSIEHVHAAPNPSLGQVDDELVRLADRDVVCVIAVGGGSVMDTAKVLAVGLGTPGFTARAHLVDGLALPTSRRVQLICVPTTAGTGSEVTPYATVWDREPVKKLSVTGDVVFPDVAVLDPALTLNVPRAVTISTGLDTLTQAFEATWSRRANPVSDAFAFRAIEVGLRVLGPLVQAPDNLELRRSMLEVSMLAGLAISRTRTALCHSISYPITGHYGVPHGLACAFTLEPVFAFNCEAAPERFESLARAVGARDASDLRDRVHRLLVELGVSELLHPYFVGKPDPSTLFDEMLTPGRADNNIRPATIADVEDIVRSAMTPSGAQDGVR